MILITKYLIIKKSLILKDAKISNGVLILMWEVMKTNLTMENPMTNLKLLEERRQTENKEKERKIK